MRMGILADSAASHFDLFTCLISMFASLCVCVWWLRQWEQANPKAVTSDELYGTMSKTKDWGC